MAKFSEEELKQLYDLAVKDGWHVLEQGERVVVSRWCKRNDKPNPRDVQVVPTNIERADAKVAELAADGALGAPTVAMPMVVMNRRVLADCLGDVFAALSRLQTVAFNEHDNVLFSYAAGILGGELAQLAANYSKEA